MQEEPKPKIDADELRDVQQRVEEHGKPEADDPDLIAADDSGVSALGQKLTEDTEQKGG